MITVPSSFAICFASRVTKLLFPIPVIARIPRCRETIWLISIRESISGFLRRLPIFTHSVFAGPKICPRSSVVASTTSVPGIGGTAGSTALPFCNDSRNPRF